MSPMIITLAAFIGVSALVAGLLFILRGGDSSKVEDRLSALAGGGGFSSLSQRDMKDSILLQSLDDGPGIASRVMKRFGSFRMLFEQADTTLSPAKFFLITGSMFVAGAAVTLYTGGDLPFVIAAGVLCSLLPFAWLMWRRRKRLKKFASQLPDALELIARALRAGHSLASGFHLVQNEMPAPIGQEFGRVFEEQNLGIPLDQAIESLADRIPNMDLRFFATAIVLQRQTGGDLAEILDKIGNLVRERFKIWGQVQALTGEGRLSGVILLALPPVLFITVYRLNPGYIMMLFSDPIGQKMLAIAVVMQLVGALVIRKIVNIKV